MNERFDPTRAIEKSIKILKRCALIVVFVVVVFYMIQFILSYPPRKYNAELRETSVVKEIIENNVDLLIVYDSQLGFFDVDGKCRDRYTLEVISGCYFSGQINYEGMRDVSIEVFYRGEEHSFSITKGTLAFHAFENGYWYADYLNVIDTQEEEGKVTLGIQLRHNQCFYAPYDFFSSTCFFGDIRKAKKVLSDHYDFLEEVGISERELVAYSLWFMDRLNHTVLD